MKDIFQILADNSIEFTEEQKASIKKAVAENYKTINEFEKKANEVKSKDDELKDRDQTIADLKSTVETLENDNKGVEELKQKIADFEQAEQARKDKAERDKALAGIRARFEPLKADKEYFNEYVENGVFDEFCKALENDANTGKSDKEIYEQITKDKDIYKNPNQRVDMPSAGAGGNKETEAIDKARAIMGLPSKES